MLRAATCLAPSAGRTPLPSAGPRSDACQRRGITLQAQPALAGLIRSQPAGQHPEHEQRSSIQHQIGLLGGAGGGADGSAAGVDHDRFITGAPGLLLPAQPPRSEPEPSEADGIAQPAAAGALLGERPRGAPTTARWFACWWIERRHLGWRSRALTGRARVSEVCISELQVSRSSSGRGVRPRPGVACSVRRESAGRLSSFLAGPRVERACGLADLDQMAVRVADVAADLVLVLLGRREELSPARAPFGVHGLDIGHADVEKGC